MGWVYRYTDLTDGIIKYVGVVWGKTRTLSKRINEHKNDDWYIGKKWKIEYIYELIETRSEAESFESHYISLYRPCYNISKVGWGLNKFLPNKENEWIEYVEESHRVAVKTKCNKQKTSESSYDKNFDSRLKNLKKEIKYDLKDYIDRVDLLCHIIEKNRDICSWGKALRPMTILCPNIKTKEYFDQFISFGIVTSIDEDRDLTISFTKPLDDKFVSYANNEVVRINRLIESATQIDKDLSIFKEE